jgi:hypothetical protein
MHTMPNGKKMAGAMKAAMGPVRVGPGGPATPTKPRAGQPQHAHMPMPGGKDRPGPGQHDWFHEHMRPKY